jgi:hypothetical protein
MQQSFADKQHASSRQRIQKAGPGGASGFYERL